MLITKLTNEFCLDPFILAAGLARQQRAIGCHVHSCTTELAAPGLFEFALELLLTKLQLPHLVLQMQQGAIWHPMPRRTTVCAPSGWSGLAAYRCLWRAWSLHLLLDDHLDRLLSGAVCAHIAKLNLPPVPYAAFSLLNFWCQVRLAV